MPNSTVSRSRWSPALCLTLTATLAVAQPAHAQYASSGAAKDKPPRSVAFPESLNPKLALLSETQLEFLRTGPADRYAKSEEKLVIQLERRTPEEVKAYVEAMIFVESQRRFVEERDLDQLPLNTGSPDFNGWQVRRPQSMNPPRDPGPLDLNRYMGSGGSIPTFANAPIALTPEDLAAGEVDVAIVGAPLNMGSGWRGAEHGPMALRIHGRLSGNDMHTQMNPSQVLNIVDYGDIAVDQDSTELTVHHVRTMLREIHQAGAMPIIIGGDHSLEYPAVAAVVDHYGKGNVTAIHFDAHHDIGRNSPHYITHGSPIYRLLREGLITGADYIQVGLRGGSPDETHFKWMQEEGFTWHTQAEIERFGWDVVIERVLESARQRSENRVFHISFDVDLLDPAYVSGTGTPVPGGMTPREVVPVIRRLCQENDVVSFDLVELAPMLDPTYVSTDHASAVVKACLVGRSLRKKGITERNYLHPMAVDHQYRIQAKEEADR
jgi:arginase